MQKLRYFGVYILALTAFISFTNKSYYTYLPLFFAFFCIPLLELFFKPNEKNINEEEKKARKKDMFFNSILYSIVPLQYGLLLLFLISMQDQLSTTEIIGRISAMGILCGILGINVGHELGHRNNAFEKFLGELLLISSLETHFLPYHNKGHHYNVATPKDPATARKNEYVFSFWFRSQFGSYFQAWEIQLKELKKNHKKFFSFQNKMLLYTLAQLIVLVTIVLIFNILTMFYFIAASIFGILMLETVNYIEHYGLLRKIKENGNYERVQPYHSWNSNHIIGRSILFELSRHSDHHYKASKHYQLLDSLPNSPQMITGYPGMMLLALVPPLWFKLMNKEIEKFEIKKAS